MIKKESRNEMRVIRHKRIRKLGSRDEIIKRSISAFCMLKN